MKDLSLEAQTALLSHHVIAFSAVEIEFNTGQYIRVHNAVGSLEIDGKLFLGAGHLGKIDTIHKDGSTSPSGLTMSMSGFEPHMLGTVMNDGYQGRPVTVYFVIMSEDYGIIDAHVVFVGKLDTMEISTEETEDQGLISTVTVTVRNRLTSWKRGNAGRYNQIDHERNLTDDQKGDKFFDQIENTASKEIEFTPVIS